MNPQIDLNLQLQKTQIKAYLLHLRSDLASFAMHFLNIWLSRYFFIRDSILVFENFGSALMYDLMNLACLLFDPFVSCFNLVCVTASGC